MKCPYCNEELEKEDVSYVKRNKKKVPAAIYHCSNCIEDFYWEFGKPLVEYKYRGTKLSISDGYKEFTCLFCNKKNYLKRDIFSDQDFYCKFCNRHISLKDTKEYDNYIDEIKGEKDTDYE